jgi:hypothetical protein
MKTIIAICLGTSLFFIAPQPKHKGLCSVSVVKSYSQNVLGKNIGYYVLFKNNASTPCDAINWTARFYNNFNDYKGTRKGSWSSGNFISPIKTSKTTQDLEGVWVSGATKVYITINRVHFTNGTSCGK